MLTHLILAALGVVAVGVLAAWIVTAISKGGSHLDTGLDLLQPPVLSDAEVYQRFADIVEATRAEDREEEPC